MSDSLTCAQRVTAAFDFANPDFVPLYDLYWGGFVTAWRDRHGLPPRSDISLDDVVYDDEDIQSYFHIDMYQVIPDEDPWPGLAVELGHERGYIIERDGWGRIVRRKTTSPYGIPLEVPLVEKADLDKLEFEPVELDQRYRAVFEGMEQARQMRHRPYIFFKTGGPYLRSSFLRGEYQWYVDIAEDPQFVEAVASRVTDHLIAVAVEALARGQLHDTCIWIYDDVASNQGPLISPKAYERLFLPQMCRMVEAFKRAGVGHVGFHSDGDVRPILDGLVDAGVSILNPVEPRANMDVVELRRRYGKRLAYVGGLCNSRVLPAGSDEEVRHHIEHVLSIADEGGLVIGSHSIGNDVTQERYELVMEILHRHGRPWPAWLS